MEVTFSLDGEPVVVDVEVDVPLVEALRGLGRTGVKEACGVGVCGLCAVIVDGTPVSSCLYLTPCVQGADVWTAAGLVGRDPGLGESFVRNEALQCGICTPGQVVAAWSFRACGVAPSDEAIRDHLAGNLCRCTGYRSIVDAVRSLHGDE